MKWFENKLEKMEAELLEHNIKFDSQESCIKELEKQYKMQLKKWIAWRIDPDNLRVTNSPEKSESGNMVAFLSKTLSQLLQIALKEKDIEVAHRVSPLSSGTQVPGGLIQTTSLQKKRDILEAAKSKDLKLEDHPFKISTDSSARRKKMWAEFWPLW